MRYVKTINWRNWFILLKLQIYKKPETETVGTANRVIPTSLFCIYLDYDNIVDERLKEELRFLQDEFELGNFHIFRTRENGRHAVCIDALTFHEVYHIVNISSCDLMFKYAPRINEFRTWILRFMPKGDRDKPEYIYTVKSKYEGKNLQSLGHARFLESNYGLKINVKKPCGDEDIEIQFYKTATRVSAKELKEQELNEEADI